MIGPDSHAVMTRGKGNNVRYVTDIINETDPADSLLVVEVITPAGNASSYPPHKHDRDAFPEETQLEEVYYHRLNPSQGFGFQRIYTDDRSLDVSMTIEDGDVTLVPRGYHPCAALHGYDLYYLNVMAGPKRALALLQRPRARVDAEGVGRRGAVPGGSTISSDALGMRLTVEAGQPRPRRKRIRVADYGNGAPRGCPAWATSTSAR